MKLSILKTVILAALGLSLLMAPFTLESGPGGKVYAMGKRSSRHEKFRKPIKPSSYSKYKVISPDQAGSEQSPTPVPVPEPTTALLLGCGLFSLAAVRKKFKK